MAPEPEPEPEPEEALPGLPTWWDTTFVAGGAGPRVASTQRGLLVAYDDRAGDGFRLARVTGGVAVERTAVERGTLLGFAATPDGAAYFLYVREETLMLAARKGGTLALRALDGWEGPADDARADLATDAAGDVHALWARGDALMHATLVGGHVVASVLDPEAGRGLTGLAIAAEEGLHVAATRAFADRCGLAGARRPRAEVLYASSVPAGAEWAVTRVDGGCDSGATFDAPAIVATPDWAERPMIVYVREARGHDGGAMVAAVPGAAGAWDRTAVHEWGRDDLPATFPALAASPEGEVVVAYRVSWLNRLGGLEGGVALEGLRGLAGYLWFEEMDAPAVTFGPEGTLALVFEDGATLLAAESLPRAPLE